MTTTEDKGGRLANRWKAGLEYMLMLLLTGGLLYLMFGIGSSPPPASKTHTESQSRHENSNKALDGILLELRENNRLLEEQNRILEEQSR